MQPHQQRVVDEKIELDTKAKALSEFIGNNPIFETLDRSEQERMKEQNDVMWRYSEILGARIAAFPRPSGPACNRSKQTDDDHYCTHCGSGDLDCGELKASGRQWTCGQCGNEFQRDDDDADWDAGDGHGANGQQAEATE